MTPNIPFIDLLAQRKRLGNKIDKSVMDVINSGQFIMGPALFEMEEKLAKFAGTKYAISCGSGTDALMMPLMAWGIGPGDAVFVPSFTFIATAEVVSLVGATPVFCDVKADTYNMDPESLKLGIEKAKSEGLTPKAIIPVDLFGLPADYDALNAIAEEQNLIILEDTAQGFGGAYKGKRSGSFGKAAATSFFPAKPLGCYGDGGAIFTDCEELTEKLKSIRVHGFGEERYHHVRIGLNGRMDTVQAAIILHKLDIFEDELAARDKIATKYTDAFKDLMVTPHVPEDHFSCWAQYTVRLNSMERQTFADALKEKGVPTAVYYPIPLHQQPGYEHYPVASTSLPVTEEICKNVISLPMHPYLEAETQDYIIKSVLEVLGA